MRLYLWLPRFIINRCLPFCRVISTTDESGNQSTRLSEGLPVRTEIPAGDLGLSSISTEHGTRAVLSYFGVLTKSQVYSFNCSENALCVGLWRLAQQSTALSELHGGIWLWMLSVSQQDRANRTTRARVRDETRVVDRGARSSTLSIFKTAHTCIYHSQGARACL